VIFSTPQASKWKQSKQTQEQAPSKNSITNIQNYTQIEP